MHFEVEGTLQNAYALTVIHRIDVLKIGIKWLLCDFVSEKELVNFVAKSHNGYFTPKWSVYGYCAFCRER